VAIARAIDREAWVSSAASCPGRAVFVGTTMLMAAATSPSGPVTGTATAMCGRVIWPRATATPVCRTCASFRRSCMGSTTVSGVNRASSDPSTSSCTSRLAFASSTSPVPVTCIGHRSPTRLLTWCTFDRMAST